MIQQIARTAICTLTLLFLMIPAALAGSIDGRVEYAQTYQLSVGVNGIVEGVAAKEGERVLAGTVLVSLNDTSFSANINAAAANLALVEEELKESQRSFERDQALYDEGSLSTVELDLARIEMLRQKSRVAEFRAALARAKSIKAMSQIVAPVAGLIVQLKTAKGQRINMSALEQPMLRFASSAFKVVAEVEPGEADVPAPGTSVKVSAADSVAGGTVRSVIYLNGKTVVTVSIDENQLSFSPGSMVNVEF